MPPRFRTSKSPGDSRLTLACGCGPDTYHEVVWNLHFDREEIAWMYRSQIMQNEKKAHNTNEFTIF